MRMQRRTRLKGFAKALKLMVKYQGLWLNSQPTRYEVSDLSRNEKVGCSFHLSGTNKYKGLLLLS